MGNLRKLVLILFGVYFLQTQAADKYTDQNRPYEFGFTIDGEQHRHEKKERMGRIKVDENGIVMGEFGFITADGVYHVTVYATDENGNFKILSMKNIRVKPYPTSPGAGVKKGKSSTISVPPKDSIPTSPGAGVQKGKYSTISVPPKDSIPESTNEEKNIKKQVASPAKSCSHCSLPTTTTTTVSPAITKIPVKLTNSLSTENYNHDQKNKNVSNKNPISLPNVRGQQKDYNSNTHESNPQGANVNYSQEEQNGENSQNGNLLPNVGGQQKDYNLNTHQSKPQGADVNYPQEEQNKKNSQNGNLLPNVGGQQKDYNSKTYQSNPQAAEVNYPQEEQNDEKSQNENLVPLQNLGYQEPNFNPIIPQSYPQSNGHTQSYLQQDIISNKPDQDVNPDREQYLAPSNRPLSTDQQISVPDKKQNNAGVSHVGSILSIDTPPSQNPISINLQEPINNDYLPNQGLPQIKQADNAVQNYKQNNLNNNQNNDNSEAPIYPEQQNYEQGSDIKEPNKLEISSPPIINSRQTIQPDNEGEKPALGNPKGERTPKSFSDFIQQSTGPEELAGTGPNLYRPSLPNASDVSEKPVLLAAQIQKVDKNTNIYSKSPGESDGLPDGVTEDDVTKLLYTFNYTVGFHGHHEKGYSNGAKQGYYYVTARNGVRTRVDYVADEKGFRPKITQELLDIVSDDVPKPETEKDEKFGLKGYEFKWLYYPLDQKSV